MTSSMVGLATISAEIRERADAARCNMSAGIILVPVDFSEHSEAALFEASRYAQAMNASLDPSLGQKSEEGIGTRIETGERRCRGGTEPVSEKALAQTVATTFSVFQGSVEVAHGSLGSNERNNLPEGDYN